MPTILSQRVDEQFKTETVNYYLAKLLAAAAGAQQPAPSAVPGTVQNPDMTSAPNFLPLFLNAIPRAEEGHVITSEYHNALRAAILAIAAQIGATTVGQTVTLTYSPTFTANKDSTPWVQLNGIAAAARNASCSGFLSLQLSDGMSIESLTVTGRRKGNIEGFVVKLVRQPVQGAALTTLIATPLEETTESFKVKGEITPPADLGEGAKLAALQDYSLVQNSKYKYMIIAESDNPADIAEIYAFQITCKP